MKRFINLTGQTYWKLQILQLNSIKDGRTYWLCRCDCGNEKIINGQSIRRGNSKSCGCLSKERGYKIIKYLHKRGERHSQWKENGLSYSGIHKWLTKKFGKANKCENSHCKYNGINFNWAKIKEKEYERKRENFIMLCASCHTKYDKK